MNFIESSKTKTLRLVGNGLIVAISFIMVIFWGYTLSIASAEIFQYVGGDELVELLLVIGVAVSFYVIAPLIILVLAIIGLIKKNFAINMVTAVFSILYGLLTCLVVPLPFLIMAAIHIIGGILTVIAAINLNREKSLYETNVLGYQEPNAMSYPRPEIKQPFPTSQQPMVNNQPQPPMKQPTPIPQQPMVNNQAQPSMVNDQPQQPVSQLVVNQPDNNISNSQEQ